jgi:hypothetical protein
MVSDQVGRRGSPQTRCTFPTRVTVDQPGRQTWHSRRLITASIRMFLSGELLTPGSPWFALGRLLTSSDDAIERQYQ